MSTTETPDLPCPKCGHSGVTIRYCIGRESWGSRIGANRGPDDPCQMKHVETEHFHRFCERCRYQWRTDDVLTATEATR